MFVFYFEHPLASFSEKNVEKHIINCFGLIQLYFHNIADDFSGLIRPC